MALSCDNLWRQVQYNEVPKRILVSAQHAATGIGVGKSHTLISVQKKTNSQAPSPIHPLSPPLSQQACPALFGCDYPEWPPDSQAGLGPPREVTQSWFRLLAGTCSSFGQGWKWVRGTHQLRGMGRNFPGVLISLLLL